MDRLLVRSDHRGRFQHRLLTSPAGADGAPLLHAVAVAAACVAMTAFSIADADGSVSAWTLSALIVVQVTATLAAALWLVRSSLRLGDTPAVSPLIVVLFVGGLLWEPVRRAVFDQGRPFEMVVMLNLKNLTLGLAAAGSTVRYQRLAFLAGLFLSMYSVAVTSEPVVPILAALFGVCGIIWLAASHWQSLEQRLLAHSSGHTGRRRMIVAAICVLVLCAAWPAGGNQFASALWGLSPSSGGTGGADDFARNGIGDGEALVAGTTNIQSFAPIEDAPLIADDEPALYDVINEAYEPPVPVKQMDRAVSLPPLMAQELERRLARSEVASREFSTLRQPRGAPSNRVGDITSDALLYVAGRTPLHLRLELFDVFDGIAWHPEPPSEHAPALVIQQVNGVHWLSTRSQFDLYGCLTGPEFHTVKVVKLNTNRIPAPPHLSGIHIDLVRQADLYRWSQDGLVEMDRETLPAGVPIHLRSDVLDDATVEADSSFFVGMGSKTHSTLPTGKTLDQVRALAQSWAAGKGPGWPQVEAITSRLREEYVHDRSLSVSDPSQLPLQDFLFHSKRGPDYQFATAAAVMLRSLGLSTRVVSGFYVRPDKYDRKSRHTPVHADDVHFWVEVYLGAQTWATVEPTPGYEVLGPPPSVWQRLVATVLSAACWGRDHWPSLTAAMLGSVVICGTRRRWLDLIRTLAWMWVPRRSAREHVVATLTLLDRRLAAVGLTRPHSCPPGEWYAGLGCLPPEHEIALTAVARWADWASFAPADPRTQRPNPNVIRADCRRAVQLARLRSLQQFAASARMNVKQALPSVNAASYSST